MIQNSQHNIKGEQSWRTGTTQLQDLLASYSNQDGMVVAKGQTNRSEERPPEIVPHKYSSLTFDISVNSIKWNKDRVFNSWYWNNWKFTWKQRKEIKWLSPFPVHLKLTTLLTIYIPKQTV